jgi:hypothetical protein
MPFVSIRQKMLDIMVTPGYRQRKRFQSAFLQCFLRIWRQLVVGTNTFFSVLFSGTNAAIAIAADPVVETLWLASARFGIG